MSVDDLDGIILLEPTTSFAIASSVDRLTSRLFDTVQKVYLVEDERRGSYAENQGNSLVSLLTSVYDGDEYIDAFLKNISDATIYHRCEHFLIRAGSPGREHVSLVRHVLSHPNAIYLYFNADPGLYEVWNLGISLSRAPYLSNANIDDRRSPGHIERLVAVLEDNPGIDVVSSALRVSEASDIEWEQSDSCGLMFGDVIGAYDVNALVRRKGGFLRSRNLPHCMPVWRRRLHAFFGYFDERRYGTSADWEFWLRAGVDGARFYFVDTPLGLYFRNPRSYWHSKLSSDNLIIDEYAPLLAQGRERCKRVEEPVSIRLRRVLEAFKESRFLEGMSAFFFCVEEFQFVDEGAARSLLSRIGCDYLGLPDIFKVFPDRNHIRNRIDRFSLQLTDIIHALDPLSLSMDARDIVKQCFLKACWELYQGETRSLLLMAMVSRKFGELEHEPALLKSAHDFNCLRFWQELQSVYRFAISTYEVSAAVSNIRAGTGSVGGRCNLFYYPYYSGNEYQRLLYMDMERNGSFVTPVRDFRDIDNLIPLFGVDNVIHVHWINPVLKRVQNEVESGTDEFVRTLKRAKRKGFRVYWTIHNRMSHEVANIKEEIALRRSLYDLSDRVYVHHPMVAELLDWLPSRDKLYFLEHGTYPSSFDAPPDRAMARSALGIERGDFVLAYVGQIRDYKDMETNFPVVLEIMEESPHARLFLLGRIGSENVRCLLANIPAERVTVRDEHVDAKELELYMRAADFGFLSYKEILTSGSLFHWASYGIPVIAPRLGTIPAYVVPGWNGFLYGDKKELSDALMRCMEMPSASRDILGQNMLAMSKTLEWRKL